MREDHSGTENHTRQSRLRRYLPLLFWMALVFLVSTGRFSASNTNLLIQPLLRWLFPNLSDERIAVAHFLLRKCGHFGEYAILGWLAARAFITSSRTGLRRRWFIAALVLVCLYSLSDEYHQSFVASRTASIYDSLIDVIGGVCALVFIAVWRKRQRRTHQD